MAGKIDEKNYKHNIHCEWYNFYMMSSLLGYDEDCNPENEKDNYSYRNELKAMMFMQIKILNIKNELNGAGYSFIFMKELK